MTDPEFLSVDDVVFLHQEQLARFGGGDGVRDRAALESAVAQPQAAFGGAPLYTDLFEQAAAYAFFLCQGHPFIDGNKRTGLAAALVFLDLNGVEIDDPAGQLYGAMLNLAERRLTRERLAKLLRDLQARSK